MRSRAEVEQMMIEILGENASKWPTRQQKIEEDLKVAKAIVKFFEGENVTVHNVPSELIWARQVLNHSA